jgi:hypothetical protein
MADLNFPSNPNVGDTYNIGTRTWVWNGNAWQIQSAITSLDPFTAKRVIVTTSTNATSTATGGLVVYGGAGIAGNLVVGPGAITRNINYAHIISSGNFQFDGDAQAGFYILRRQVAAAIATALTTDGTAAGTTNQIILPNNSAFSFKILVTAKATTSANEGAWEFNGIISKVTGTASTAVKVVNKTKIWSSNAAYDVNVIADTVYGGLQVVATAADSNPVRFVARVETVEITT